MEVEEEGRNSEDEWLCVVTIGLTAGLGRRRNTSLA